MNFIYTPLFHTHSINNRIEINILKFNVNTLFEQEEILQNSHNCKIDILFTKKTQLFTLYKQ